MRPRSVHSSGYQLLAARLRDARNTAGSTQREVADRLAKPPSYVHKVENGERELNVIELFDYCAALEVDAIEFIRGLQGAIAQSRKDETGNA